MTVVRIVPAGDGGVCVRFADAISNEAHARVLATMAVLDRDRPAGVTDVVPGYASLLVTCDPGRADPAAVRTWIDAAVSNSGAAPSPALAAGVRVEIPVLYHPRVAPDLVPLAQEKALTVAEVVALHTAPEYRCLMLGFRPGFPFLGGLDPRLHAPRLDTPRAAVAAGSVGIGGPQTGVYPVDGPGGWRLIGRTPSRLFDPGRADPFLVNAGDAVKFVAIDETTFERLAARGGR